MHSPMKAVKILPDNYKEVIQINLQSDKKTALFVNVLGAVVMIVVLALGHFIVPITAVVNDMDNGSFWVKLLVMFAAYAGYMILHELTHAVVMRAVGGGKVRFGFTGMYAYAGSTEDFFDKIAYRCIALAPLVVWGIVFGILAVSIPADWFWVIWFLQAGNIGGAAGDVYVTVKLLKYPETILIRDTGLDMTVFNR